MKILKYLLYVLLALVVIGVILGLVGPKSYDVSRSKVIAATPEQIWPYITSFPKSQLWSPWMEEDTTSTVEFSGEEGAVGSKQTWKSKMGGGEETITALVPYKSVDSELKFFMPWGDGSASTGYQLQDTSGGTKLTWNMKGDLGFIWRIMASFRNMDKGIGMEFEKGLANLDSLMATLPNAPAPPSISIMPGEYPGGKYLGVRSKVKISGMKDFFSTSFSQVMEGLKTAKGEMAGMPSGIYFTWEPDKDMTDMAAAVPVKNDIKAPKGLTFFTVPASKSLTIDYMGGYSGLGNAHNAMDAYIKANSLTQSAPVIEEYITDPMSEQDSMKWHTKIVYFVK